MGAALVPSALQTRLEKHPPHRIENHVAGAERVPSSSLFRDDPSAIRRPQDFRKTVAGSLDKPLVFTDLIPVTVPPPPPVENGPLRAVERPGF